MLGASFPVSTAKRFGDGDGPCGAPLEPGVAGRTAFTLRVQTGCEERCSYCIIPRTRGRSRSRPLAEITDQIEHVVASGYKEIVITGVHLGSYGRDLPEPVISRRARASPGDLGGRRVVPYQLARADGLHGRDCRTRRPTRRDSLLISICLFNTVDDDVLRRMRRPYTAAAYRRLVERIHSQMPHASVGSDIIVGFPGETATQFDRSESFLCELPLTHLHVFPYSDRPGTVASVMPDKVDGATVRERGQRIRAIGQEMASGSGARRRARRVAR